MVKVWYSLYGRMLSRAALHKAFNRVKSAKGAAGIDGQSIKDFSESLSENLDQLLVELREESYQPQAVRRVEIPKPDGGIRKLGIPAVRDRIVQQALLDILQPIFDPEFHPSSYGYRPGRSCHQAISKATMFIRRYDRKWVVDMDLSKCFDTLDQGLILSSFRRRISDGSILDLVNKFLKSGVMTGEGWQASNTGSPQGGVISPLIANVYLDSFVISWSGLYNTWAYLNIPGVGLHVWRSGGRTALAEYLGQVLPTTAHKKVDKKLLCDKMYRAVCFFCRRGNLWLYRQKAKRPGHG